MKIRTIILGAGGRDFFHFLRVYKENPKYKVMAFTATQIPFIEKRKFPKELAGRFYKKDIPIYPEKELPKLIEKLKIKEVNFAYSDVSYKHLNKLRKITEKLKARFRLLKPEETMLKSKKFVISVCGSRTGAGKGTLVKRILSFFKKLNKRIVIIRHPMAYGNIKEKAVERFASLRDLQKKEITLEEREEYERHLKEGFVVYAGYDMEKILKRAEKEAEIILWNGGNNDFPFIKPNYQIVVVDARRPGHEIKYFPSDITVRLADLLIINKVDVVPKRNVEIVRNNLRKLNKRAKILLARMKLIVDKPELVKNKVVLCIEDGPTLTHGGLPTGAAFQAAKELKAKKIIDPRRFASGLIKDTFRKYPHLKKCLPAVGYNREQLKDLETTIEKTKCDSLVVATPIDLSKIIKIEKPIVRVNYEIEEIGPWKIETILNNVITNHFDKDLIFSHPLLTLPSPKEKGWDIHKILDFIFNFC